MIPVGAHSGPTSMVQSPRAKLVADPTTSAIPQRSMAAPSSSSSAATDEPWRSSASPFVEPPELLAPLEARLGLLRNQLLSIDVVFSSSGRRGSEAGSTTRWGVEAGAGGCAAAERVRATM